MNFDQFITTNVSASQIIPENIFLHNLIDNNIVQLEIDPIDFCNHNCKWCFTSNFRDDRKLPLDSLKNYLDLFISNSGKAVAFSGGGEPLLYKEIYTPNPIFGNSVLQYLISHNIHVGIITNGMLLNKLLSSDFCINDLAFIRVSLDATNSKTHAILHETTIGDFDNIIQNLKDIISKRGQSFTPAIGISFVVDPTAEINFGITQIELINKLAVELSIDFVQFKHIHTSETHTAQKCMLQLHSDCQNFNWKNTEFWVQTYADAKSYKVCNISQHIQAIGQDSKKFPCCHNFGRYDFLNQNKFAPIGEKVINCQSIVCRYNEVNNLLSLNSADKSEQYTKLYKSIEQFGFHPYRLFPSAPQIITPYKSSI